MTDINTLARARKSFEQSAWADAYRLFEAADREAALEPEDLERLATATYAPSYDWIDLSLRTHNGLPIHDRGIVETCPGLSSSGFSSSTR